MEIEFIFSKPMISGIDIVKVWCIGKDFCGRSYEITLDKESNLFILTALDDTKPRELKPFIELSTAFFEALLKSMAKYAKEKNVQMEDENLLKGKYDATIKHLEDMRKLVFNKNK